MPFTINCTGTLAGGTVYVYGRAFGTQETFTGNSPPLRYKNICVNL